MSVGVAHARTMLLVVQVGQCGNQVGAPSRSSPCLLRSL